MSLSLFHPIVKEWFLKHVGTPTDVQDQAWPLIQQGNHVLVTAPTGCGKTFTAFLWAIHQLVEGVWSGGQTRVLYISPLKALNNDVQRNLLKPLEQLRDFFAQHGQSMPEITVLTRSGDTPPHERAQMRKRSPEILITTPESLNILLTAKGYQQMLTGIETVILDEIHAVVGGKRGTHLITAIDRLVPLAGEFQRIALSATVTPLDRVARYVGGYQQTGPDSYSPRRVVTVSSKQTKQYALTVDFPEDAREKLTEDSWWPALIEQYKAVLKQNRSTLLFANSRRLVEKVARLINEDEDEVLVYAHHGSLSKEIRLAVEQKLKRGELRGIVATNSLELGIDIGSLDEVILVQTPFSVSSTVQRLGRAGHQVGQVSKGGVYPTHGGDFLAAAVMTKAVYEGDIEDVNPIDGPLDVLTQVILSACVTQTWDLDKLYCFLRTSAPYYSLSRERYDLVIQMLEGRYADSRLRELKPRVLVDRLDNTIKAKDSSAFLLFMAGGTIPDRGYYDLRLQDNKAKIGELDEEFVWERSIGETFALGNQVWRIQRITHNDVEVTPETKQLNIIPFWKADDRDASYHFAAKMGEFLEWANETLDGPEFKPTLLRDYHMTKPAADELTSYLLRQRDATKSDLPHRTHLLFEHFQDPNNKQDAHQIILYTFWGGKVNRPLGLALSAAWEERYHHPLQVFVNNDAVLLMLSSECSAPELMSLLTPENVEGYLTKKLEQTGTFGAHFRENAGRALLLPKQNFKKRMPLWLNRLRAKKLLQSIQRYDDFPVLLETWRSCLQDEFDIPSLKQCLERVHTQEIRVTSVNTHRPSPFAGSLVWRQTNKYMYDDDTPLAQNRVSLKQDLLKDLLFSSHLRPQIPPPMIATLEAKRQRTHPGYTPESSDDLLELVKDRLLIPEDEWQQLQEAIERDQGDAEAFIKSIRTKLAKISWSETIFITARETVPRILVLWEQDETNRYTSLQNKTIKQPPSKPTNEEELNSDRASFLSQWLSYYGPMVPERVKEPFGLDGSLWTQLLESLVHNEHVVFDTLTEGVTAQEVCDVTNLEILLRMLRRSRQPGFQARPLEELPVFLAQYQGLIRHGSRTEDLQQILNQFFGLALAPQLWEEVIFPSRLEPYFSSWLDSLVQEHGLVLQGHPGKKLSFIFPEDRDIFPPPPYDVTTENLLPLDPTGRHSLMDLVEKTQLTSSELTQKLWNAFWQGRMSIDAFPALRKGIVSKFKVQTQTQSPRPGRMSRRSGFSRWQADRPMAGSWYVLESPEATDDPIEAEELNKDRVRQLLCRYGILFRELLQREQPALQWRSVFRSLRLMEFAGEVITGQFFDNIPGLQFMSHEAFDLLKQGINDETVIWINAMDPASLCGVGLEGLKAQLPNRIASNYIVYHGSRIVLTVQRNGKTLQCHVEPGHVRIPDYLHLFKILIERDFNPHKRIIIETINDEPAGKSPYAKAFQQFGFERNLNNLELWKRYS